MKANNNGPAYSILITCGIGHFLNDMIQSVIPSIYPLIKDTYGFSFAQIGIITLVAQMASGGKKSLAQSIFQVGGNGGNALGPILAALIVLPFGQSSIRWFAMHPFDRRVSSSCGQLRRKLHKPH